MAKEVDDLTIPVPHRIVHWNNQQWLVIEDGDCSIISKLQDVMQVSVNDYSIEVKCVDNGLIYKDSIPRHKEDRIEGRLQPYRVEPRSVPTYHSRNTLPQIMENPF